MRRASLYSQCRKVQHCNMKTGRLLPSPFSFIGLTEVNAELFYSLPGSLLQSQVIFTSCLSEFILTVVSIWWKLSRTSRLMPVKIEGAIGFQ